jgi:hypothetical protein
MNPACSRVCVRPSISTRALLRATEPHCIVCDSTAANKARSTRTVLQHLCRMILNPQRRASACADQHRLVLIMLSAPALFPASQVQRCEGQGQGNRRVRLLLSRRAGSVSHTAAAGHMRLQAPSLKRDSKGGAAIWPLLHESAHAELLQHLRL